MVGITLSKEEMAEVAAKLGWTNAPSQAVLLPLDFSQPVRLVIGVASLPLGMPVELEVIFEVAD